MTSMLSHSGRAVSRNINSKPSRPSRAIDHGPRVYDDVQASQANIAAVKGT